MTRLIIFTFALSLTAACGGSDPMGQGFTDCNGTTCQPGQYCDTAFFCSVGCTSDVNCASNQFCDTANPDFVGVSQCVNRAATPDSGPARDSGPNPTDTGPSGGACDGIAQELLDCGEIDNVEFAQLKSGCDNNVLTPQQQAALIACVNAGTNCAQKANCIDDGTCASDTECDQTRGDNTHMICEGGFCQFGCRDAADCGDTSVCDDFSNSCMPDF